MSDSIKKEAFNNPAVPVTTNEKMTYKIPDGNRCTEEITEDIVFAMQDARGVFSIGLTTILKALMIAEENHLVPEIPHNWKYEVINRYLE